MRLISLTANRNSFKSVYFNETGMTLIVGTQKETDEDTSKRTYNGVGKSLLVALIHYCLGSKRIQAFEDNLQGWEFQLKFRHNNEEHTATRSVDKPNKISFDGDEQKLSDFTKSLQKMVFSSSYGISYLTFRSLIQNFIRKNRSAYESFDSASYKKEKAYQSQLRLAYLLGLDVSYAVDKYKLRQKIHDLDNKQKQFEKDKLFKHFFVGDSNPEIELHALSRNIRTLEARLGKYVVAEDYHTKQREANDVTYNLQQLRNKQELISKALVHINESLKIQPDLTPARIYAIYKEAETTLPDLIKHKIEQVSEFNAKLVQVRSKKLAQEKTRLNNRLERLLKRITEVNDQRDHLLQYLGTRGALDEYTALSNQLGAMKAEVQKIKDYQQLLRGYRDEKIKAQMKSKQNDVATNQYLEDVRTTTESNMDAFTNFSGEFYEEKPGGLTVTSNQGDNQIRFDIDARIQDDAADGINEVKIFCFDMTVLTQKHNHLMDFVFHDSRLFSDMDPRQKAIALALALEVSKQPNYQYIATVNQDLLESSRSQWSSEINQAIDKSIVLKLTDEGPESKLLGIQVDMDYDKEN
ncbi:DUF2326 domain-containing protein [bacterium]|nr:DUF2326 domain-containing protein [bacterium]